MDIGIKTGSSASRNVCDRIREYILSSNLPPRTKLPSELELSEMFGVSRSSIREGVRMLEGAGFVISRQGDGIYVAEYNGDLVVDYVHYGIHSGRSDVRELYEVRRQLELAFLEEAFNKLEREQLLQLERIVDEMEHSEDAEKLHLLDRDFHMTLFEKLDNQLALRLMRLYWNVVLDRPIPENKVLPEVNVENHRLVMRALQSGSWKFVRSSMEIHMYDSFAAEQKG